MATPPLSSKGYFERMWSQQALGGLQPMDAGYVWTLVDNVQHLIDQSGVYRVNWHGGSAPGNHYGLATPRWHTWFPTQLYSLNQYPAYDIRVGLADSYVRPLRISLVTPTTQPPITGMDSGVLGTFDTMTVVNNHMYEMRFESRATADAPMHTIVAPSIGPDYPVGTMALLKLLIETDVVLDGAGEPTTSTTILSVQVREYAR